MDIKGNLNSDALHVSTTSAPVVTLELTDAAALPLSIFKWNGSNPNNYRVQFNNGGSTVGLLQALSASNGSGIQLMGGGSGEGVFVSYTGLVGINNSSPATALDVTGGVNATTYNVGGTAGASGTFTTTDLKTVTVTNGLITSIV